MRELSVAEQRYQAVLAGEVRGWRSGEPRRSFASPEVVSSSDERRRRGRDREDAVLAGRIERARATGNPRATQERNQILNISFTDSGVDEGHHQIAPNSADAEYECR